MKSKKGLIILIIVIVLAGALAVVYFFGRNYFSSHFFPGTMINGMDVGGKTVEEAKEEIQDNITNYDLVIEEREDKEEEITGDELGLKYVDDGGVEKLMKEQDADSWPLRITQNKSYETSANCEYDEKDLEKIVDGLDCFKEENITDPADAYVNFNGEQFEVVAEVVGTKPVRSKILKDIKKAIKSSTETINLDKDNCYQNPEVYSDDQNLNDEVSQKNSLLGASITYDFVDRQFTADASVIKDWFSQDENGSYYLDQTKIASWVQDMAYQTDTFGLERDFTTSTGETIRLAGGGDYGWCIDQEATTEALYNKVMEGANEVIEPEYLYRANDRSTNDIGGTYCEVCISSQTMWCYKDGQLVVETPIISGCHETGFDTPSGSCWAIDGKKPDMNFTIFSNITVAYWLPFNGDCGIHDATWQSDEAYANPESYLTAGSHGCINTPIDACGQVFDAMEIGDPVIVYYSVDQVVGPEPTQEVKAG